MDGSLSQLSNYCTEERLWQHCMSTRLIMTGGGYRPGQGRDKERRGEKRSEKREKICGG